MKPMSSSYYTLSPLQEHLLANLARLHATDADVNNWLPYDINGVDRFAGGHPTKVELAEALRSMALKGLVEGVRVPYCAFRRFRITEAGTTRVNS